MNMIRPSRTLGSLAATYHAKFEVDPMISSNNYLDDESGE
jgi:hypothetical protein